MIIDAHAHVFPFLQHAPGERHLAFLQRGLNGNRQPVRRTSDNAIVPHQIWDPDDFSPAGMQEIGFHVGRFGRFEWSIDGVEYYKQFMPPSLVDNACDADYLIAEMDYAGIDLAILQNDHFYGALDAMFAEAVARYPGRLIGTAHVDETRVGEQSMIDDLHAAAGQLGLRGIFFDSRTYWTGTNANEVDSDEQLPFWRTVEQLGLVTYWVPGAAIGSGNEGYLGQFRRWQRLLERCPNLNMVVPGGLAGSVVDHDVKQLPAVIVELASTGQVCFELLYPISVGGHQEYPYHEALEEIRIIFHSCGARAFAWGSDIPNVLRHCTYAQSLEYLRRHAGFIAPEEMDAILGGNLKRLFRFGD